MNVKAIIEIQYNLIYDIILQITVMTIQTSVSFDREDLKGADYITEGEKSLANRPGIEQPSGRSLCTWPARAHTNT